MEKFKVDNLKVAAGNFGFDAGWIADVLEQFGPEVLSWAIELARNGFSVGFIVEILQTVGPWLLEMLAEWTNRRNMAALAAKGFAGPADGVVVPGPVVEGVDASFIDMIVEKYLPLIVEKYLPLIMEKYGPQLIQMLIEMFLKGLQK
jgi:hypothetical protein